MQRYIPIEERVPTTSICSCVRSARCVLGFSLFLRFTVPPLHAFSLSLSSHFLDYVSNDDQLFFSHRFTHQSLSHYHYQNIMMSLLKSIPSTRCYFNRLSPFFLMYLLPHTTGTEIVTPMELMITPPPTIFKPKQLWTGKQVVSSLLAHMCRPPLPQLNLGTLYSLSLPLSLPLSISLYQCLYLSLLILIFASLSNSLISFITLSLICRRQNPNTTNSFRSGT